MLSDGGLMSFPNVLLPTGPMPYADVGKTLEESVVCWDDLKWIRDLWDGKIVVKGVHTGEDAQRVVAEGADALVVSNHGGRQLDGVPGSIRSLPEVVAAAGNKIEVLVDGGIRNGGDVVKALSLGAKGVLIGRAYAYGLAAAGEPGVTRAIEILRTRHRADDEAAWRVVGPRSEPVVHRRARRAGSRGTRLKLESGN